MKKHIFYLLLIFGFMSCQSQNTIVNIWDEIPNSKPTNEEEKIILNNNTKEIYAVKNPTLEIFLPSSDIKKTDKAILILPGGGYEFLAYTREGEDIAKWFNSKGITAFVLKYRLPTSKSLITPFEAPLQDAQRAIRWVRLNAEKWNINKNKIGVLGFSAGGHLAATLGTQYDSKNNFTEKPIDTISAKPNFLVLIYPVISMQDEITHEGSRQNLIGKNPSEELINRFSNELNVTKNIPPTFLIHATDDVLVTAKNSLVFYNALLENNVKAAMHIYPFGGHGFDLAVGRGYLETWTNRLYDWLENLD